MMEECLVDILGVDLAKDSFQSLRNIFYRTGGRLQGIITDVAIMIEFDIYIMPDMFLDTCMDGFIPDGAIRVGYGYVDGNGAGDGEGYFDSSSVAYVFGSYAFGDSIND